MHQMHQKMHQKDPMTLWMRMIAHSFAQWRGGMYEEMQKKKKPRN